MQATLANVAITVDVMDRNGNQNGLTPFVRSYAPCQGYTLTAPLTVLDATNVTWDFVRWSVRFSPTGALTSPSARTST